MGDVFQLSDGLKGLGNVHIHLIAIEVSIVRRANRQVEPEGVVGKDPYAVSHHTHPVQGWLSVEQNIITVFKSALDNRAVAEMLLDQLRFVCYFAEEDEVLVSLVLN